MSEYPVQIDVASPPRFERVQILVRLLLSVVLGWLGLTAGWLVTALYGALPLVAAIGVSSVGAERFREELAPRVWRPLRWLLEVWAFTGLLVDVLPGGREDPVRASIQIRGKPTTGSALLRLVTSIPSGFVLSLLWCASALVWFIACISVLVSETVPSSLLGFQRGVLRWNARLVAYHASLVDEYPPFALDTSDTGAIDADNLHHHSV